MVRKNRTRRILSVLLAGILCLSMALPVQADEISDTKEKQKELEEQKAEAEKEHADLEKQLNEIVDDITETQNNLTAKEQEINEAETELVYALARENDQYNSMKLRIKYMYENGNTDFIEILMDSKSIADLLNKAEYILQISKKDREMLVEYQNTRMEIERRRAELEQEYAELEQLQNELEEKQSNLEQLLEEKASEISELSSEIDETSEKLKELIAAAEAAEKAAREAAARRAQSAGGSGYQDGGGNGQTVVSGSGTLSHPIPGARITSGFGYRVAPTAGATSRHDGIDFGASTGTPIYAAESGTVITATYNSARGYYIVVNHGGGLQTWYQHCSALYVGVGAQVTKGQNIAAVGSTGIVTGPHLHFEVHVNGTPVDPMNYL